MTDVLPDRPRKLADDRLEAPSVQRNRDAILETLAPLLDGEAKVLEIASGTGEHAVFLGSRLPRVEWQPSDPEPERRRSIRAWIAHTNVVNVRPPLCLHTQRDPWPPGPFDGIVCINMLHISPWPSCRSLMEGGRRVLKPTGFLYIYGPFKREGRHTSSSNASFDRWLRKHDSAWGVRDVEAIQREADRVGLKRKAIIEMPADNLSLIFEMG